MKRLGWEGCVAVGLEAMNAAEKLDWHLALSASVANGDVEFSPGEVFAP